jgi:putative heme transporter
VTDTQCNQKSLFVIFGGGVGLLRSHRQRSRRSGHRPGNGHVNHTTAPFPATVALVTDYLTTERRVAAEPTVTADEATRSEQPVEPSTRTEDVTHLVPKGLRVAAEFSWRFLVIAAAFGVLFWVGGQLSLLTITLAIALLLSALMAPIVDLLMKRRFPRGLAVAAARVGGLAVLGGLITFVIWAFTDGLPELQTQLNRSLDQVKVWLTEGPLALDARDFQDFVDQAISLIQQHQAAITTQALTTAGAVGTFLTGFILVLFILIFFLLHGEHIWSFLVKAVPAEGRRQVDIAGRRGFASLVSYIRATFIGALAAAVGIGLGLAILGVPLVIPLATLVFLGAFIPIVGAIVTGAIAVLVALVTVGWVKALIVLGIVIAVQQLESNVLAPFLLGRAVKLHPLAVILAITAGLVVAGITGALLAVPLLAVINAGAKSLMSDDAAADPEKVPITSRHGSQPGVVEEPSPPDPDEEAGDTAER